MNNKFLKTENIFPIIVLLFSVMHLSKQIHGIHYLSTLISIIGIIGCVLYYLNNERYRTLIYLWIIAQIVVIERESLNQITGQWFDNPIWDLTQGFSLNFGFYTVSDTSRIGFKINIVALLFLGFLKILEQASLKGSSVQFEKYRDDNQLGDIFPLYGTIIERVKLSGEKGWLLVKLNSSFEYEDKPIQFVIIKTRDGVLQKNHKNDLVYFRLVTNDLDLNSDVLDSKRNLLSGKNDINDFPFIDWALCKVL